MLTDGAWFRILHESIELGGIYINDTVSATEQLSVLRSRHNKDNVTPNIYYRHIIAHPDVWGMWCLLKIIFSAFDSDHMPCVWYMCYIRPCHDLLCCLHEAETLRSLFKNSFLHRRILVYHLIQSKSRIKPTRDKELDFYTYLSQQRSMETLKVTPINKYYCIHFRSSNKPSGWHKNNEI